jgi:DNA-directed RNA polymerase subunit RPC12/RpoP
MIVSYACPACGTFIAACSANTPVAGSTICPGCNYPILFKNAGATLKDKIKISEYPFDLITLLNMEGGYGQPKEA